MLQEGLNQKLPFLRFVSSLSSFLFLSEAKSKYRLINYKASVSLICQQNKRNSSRGFNCLSLSQRIEDLMCNQGSISPTQWCKAQMAHGVKDAIEFYQLNCARLYQCTQLEVVLNFYTLYQTWPKCGPPTYNCGP